MLFSEPKIPQTPRTQRTMVVCVSFSALQRAENSSNVPYPGMTLVWIGFSALQRAENSSNGACCARRLRKSTVSVLFSEPKIPQSNRKATRTRSNRRFQCSSASRKFLKVHRVGAAQRAVVVSVLFSEPKIPQIHTRLRKKRRGDRFSALQRAENSSKLRTRRDLNERTEFQCSSASRKFLKEVGECRTLELLPFQCSSASRKFLKRQRSIAARAAVRFQCSSASRKFLKCFGSSRRCQIRRAFQCSSASRKFLNLHRIRWATMRPSGFSALQRAENSSIGRSC